MKNFRLEKRKEYALINLHTPCRKYLPQTETLNIIFKTMRFSFCKDIVSSSGAWCWLFALLHHFSPKSLLENPRLVLLLPPADLICKEELTPLHLGLIFWMTGYLVPPQRQKTSHCPDWRRRKRLEWYNLPKNRAKGYFYWYKFIA